MTQLALLGRLVPVTVDPAVQPNDATHALAVLIGATTFLQSNSKTLTPGMISYIGSLAGLGIAPNRSFTPCAGTADQEAGDYNFYIGVEDLQINATRSGGRAASSTTAAMRGCPSGPGLDRSSRSSRC